MKKAGPVTDWQLERYLLRELPAEENEWIRRQLEEDETVAKRLELLEESNREILRAYPPETMASRIRRRCEKERADASRTIRSRTIKVVSYTLPAAAAVALLITLTPLAEWLRGPEAGLATVRLKGVDGSLAVYRRIAGGAEKLSGGSLARQNDVIRLAYRSGGARYGIILSVDGRGVITWHLPEDSGGLPDRAPPLTDGGEVALGSAYVLDDAPAFERFFFVFSDRPFRTSSVVEAARRLVSSGLKSMENDALAVGKRLGQVSFLLAKNGGRS